ncbi:MAG: uroporphyrinogen decarboxylase family protein [Geobacter sp.]|nr:uroporphyrinogen decarboxylase family protein [Geobacter sp.]
MNALQRFAAMTKGEPLDRLPCVPIIGNTAARVIGVKVSAIRGDARLLADAQVAAYRRFGFDVIRVFTDLYVQAEAMGARVKVPEDETAYLDAPAITDIAEIDRLRPLNPSRDGLIPAHLEAMRRVADAVGGEVPVTGALCAPFTTASLLVGAEQLVRLTLKDPEAVHRLCRLALESCLAYADAIIEAGATPSLTDPMASATVISPRQFREFAFPYLKELIGHIHSRGRSVTLHICGRTSKIWEAMAEAGADCLSIDNEASLADAKVAVGERVRLMGNVRPSEVMLQGTPADVRRGVIDCVCVAHDSPKGYIVASGCSLPTETPFANIHAMMDAVREIGWPVRPEKLGGRT